MSRIGKQPVPIPNGVVVGIENQTVTVKGKRGELVRTFPETVGITQDGGKLVVRPNGDIKEVKPDWGMARAMLSNMVVGVSDGFVKNLEIIGVGYRAAVQGNFLNLSLGFSHPVNYPIPPGITVTVDKNTLLKIEGYDKEILGRICAEIRAYRPPEPYKGKGIRYAGEYVIQKVGKKKKK
ncbi:MAG: 50S ribosomal protein L6 [Magnetococcales bacterium]|nr:50S ribosomal protein L6 [Magnetococcales bacterium]